MKKMCDSCSGTGQISYFQGESRFLLTYEECPECNGTGQEDMQEQGEENDDEQKDY